MVYRECSSTRLLKLVEGWYVPRNGRYYVIAFLSFELCHFHWYFFFTKVIFWDIVDAHLYSYILHLYIFENTYISCIPNIWYMHVVLYTPFIHSWQIRSFRDKCAFYKGIITFKIKCNQLNFILSFKLVYYWFIYPEIYYYTTSCIVCVVQK